MNITMFASIPLGPTWIPVCILGYVIGRNPELREPICFIMGSKHTCPLLQREAVYRLHGFCLPNILEKIVQNKGIQGLCLQDVQKCEKLVETCLLVVTKLRTF